MIIGCFNFLVHILNIYSGWASGLVLKYFEKYHLLGIFQGMDIDMIFQCSSLNNISTLLRAGGMLDVLAAACDRLFIGCSSTGIIVLEHSGSMRGVTCFV
ncbi:unnamed protein product [Pylaiella littoralis]